MGEYAGRRIWIVGASSGIGEALAKEFALRGAKIILSARNEEKLQTISTSLKGGGHLVRPLDVRDIKSIENIIDDLHNQDLKLDTVIFMPALYGTHSSKGHDIDFIHQMIEVNLTGAFNLMYYLKSFF